MPVFICARLLKASAIQWLYNWHLTDRPSKLSGYLTEFRHYLDTSVQIRQRRKVAVQCWKTDRLFGWTCSDCPSPKVINAIENWQDISTTRVVQFIFRGGFLKIITVGIPTYADVKTSFSRWRQLGNRFSRRHRSECRLKQSLKTHLWSRAGLNWGDK